ncbi:hypothetical protein B5807_12024 [Epicoccum nigrum]|uniref:Heterokaryon incompatibility domain-containing protein n=1 Tax=Epicoccum nigrum TaxID=105696 RepID=A0A1Y2LHF0_EPING|nr:hypothetical protein B5807_12024 [Epicoccum nigrum]
MMYLFNTINLKLHNFSANPPDYVILSHTWGDEEVGFDEIQHSKRRALQKKKGYDKIVSCCNQALSDGFFWAWVDTYCIDRRSSSELSEAITNCTNGTGGLKSAMFTSPMSDQTIPKTHS